jgi:hypothetical protein
MHGVGLREWVALGVLGVGIVLGFLFFDPTSTDGGSPRSPVPVPTFEGQVEVDSTRTVLPTPSPTPTPVPVHRVEQPTGGWLVTYYQSLSSGGEIRSGEGFVATLDLEFPGKPFPDFRDDAWRATASQSVATSPGRNSVRLLTDGAVRVSVDGKQVFEAPDASSAQERTVEFDSRGTSASFEVEVRDTGGPVVLRWVN